jgi:hypothetical protein
LLTNEASAGVFFAAADEMYRLRKNQIRQRRLITMGKKNGGQKTRKKTYKYAGVVCVHRADDVRFWVLRGDDEDYLKVAVAHLRDFLGNLLADKDYEEIEAYTVDYVALRELVNLLDKTESIASLTARRGMGGIYSFTTYSLSRRTGKGKKGSSQSTPQSKSLKIFQAPKRSLSGRVVLEPSK